MDGFISDLKRFSVTGLLILFSLGFLGFFQESDKVSPVLQGFIVSVIFFLAIPVLYSKIVLKEPLAGMGWQKGRVLTGIAVGLGCVVFATAVSFFLIEMTSFREEYSLPGLAESDFFWFVLYEMMLVSFSAFLYEVFFRGLVQLLWLRDFGWLAVVAQAGLFFLFLYLSGSFTWQYVPILIFAPISGIVAHMSRSIWYPFAASWLFIFLTDILVLSLR